jgi:hypothetical protein
VRNVLVHVGDKREFDDSEGKLAATRHWLPAWSSVEEVMVWWQAVQRGPATQQVAVRRVCECLLGPLAALFRDVPSAVLHHTKQLALHRSGWAGPVDMGAYQRWRAAVVTEGARLAAGGAAGPAHQDGGEAVSTREHIWALSLAENSLDVEVVDLEYLQLCASKARCARARGSGRHARLSVAFAGPRDRGSEPPGWPARAY